MTLGIDKEKIVAMQWITSSLLYHLFSFFPFNKGVYLSFECFFCLSKANFVCPPSMEEGNVLVLKQGCFASSQIIINLGANVQTKTVVVR